MKDVITKNKMAKRMQTKEAANTNKNGVKTDPLLSFVKGQFTNAYPHHSFENAWEEYQSLEQFKISDNVETVGGISEQGHFIMRSATEYHLIQAFKAMKIDLDDPNVGGEKGTPYRMAKMYCGAHLNDDSELLSGRWTNKPLMTSFPNVSNQRFPITKKVDILSVCSHHVAPFSTMFRDNAYAIISYIPKNQVLGISKLQRIVDWVARRGHLQEELTMKIYNEVCEAAGTPSVYVRLSGLVHTCESLRGTQSKDGAFTSEHYGGDFQNFELRKEVLTA